MKVAVFGGSQQGVLEVFNTEERGGVVKIGLKGSNGEGVMLTIKLPSPDVKVEDMND